VGVGRAAFASKQGTDRTSGQRSTNPAQRHLLDLVTGAPWRDLPERFGPWQTVYHHFSNWRKDGIFARIIEVLQIKLDQQGLIDWDLWCVDGSNVRATRAAAGADKKVSSATPMSRPTTLWAAAEAGLEPSSIWLLTARELR